MDEAAARHDLNQVRQEKGDWPFVDWCLGTVLNEAQRHAWWHMPQRYLGFDTPQQAWLGLNHQKERVIKLAADILIGSLATADSA